MNLYRIDTRGQFRSEIKSIIARCCGFLATKGKSATNEIDDDVSISKPSRHYTDNENENIKKKEYSMIDAENVLLVMEHSQDLGMEEKNILLQILGDGEPSSLFDDDDLLGEFHA